MLLQMAGFPAFSLLYNILNSLSLSIYMYILYNLYIHNYICTIHPYAGGHSGFSHILAIVSDVAMSMVVKVCLWYSVHFLWVCTWEWPCWIIQ